MCMNLYQTRGQSCMLLNSVMPVGSSLTGCASDTSKLVCDYMRISKSTPIGLLKAQQKVFHFFPITIFLSFILMKSNENLLIFVEKNTM